MVGILRTVRPYILGGLKCVLFSKTALIPAKKKHIFTIANSTDYSLCNKLLLINYGFGNLFLRSHVLIVDTVLILCTTIMKNFYQNTLAFLLFLLDRKSVV